MTRMPWNEEFSIILSTKSRLSFMLPSVVFFSLGESWAIFLRSILSPCLTHSIPRVINHDIEKKQQKKTMILDSYHQNADLSDSIAPRKSGRMMLNKDVINKRISLRASAIVKIDTQNLIISRRAKTNIDRRFPIIPIATAHGITKCIQI